MELEVFFHPVRNCINTDGMCYFHNSNPELFSGAKNIQMPCVLKCKFMQKGDEVLPEFSTSKAPSFNAYLELYEFHKMGIEYIKLGSRGSKSGDKYIQIKFLRELLDALDNKEMSKKEFMEYAYKVIRDT